MPTAFTASATELARQLRAGTIRSRELVEAHLAHIGRVNPALNAFVGLRADEALAEADAADVALKAAKTKSAKAALPEFLGVPCSIKETFALKGLSQTGGLVSRRDRISDADAPTVAAYRAAGAIPLGITNTSELAMWMESFNKLYGRTNNPYDLGRTCGGSSGGEGAAVGAGCAPFGLGSDIGGSIRMPAFFNGVFGHKPTGGLVSNVGQYPIAEGAALDYQCTGPITRRAEDLHPLLRVLAGPDAAIQDPGEVAISDLTVHVVTGDGLWRVDRELLAAQQLAADALQAAGARVVRTQIPQLKRAFEVWSAMLAAESTPFRTQLSEGKAFDVRAELLSFARRTSPHTFPALGLALVEMVPERMPARGAKSIAAGLQLRDEIGDLLSGNTVLLYPPYPELAPKHNRALLPPLKFTYTAIWNVLHTPVTQVPLGLSRAGLPLGVQVVAAPGADHLSLAVALHLEKAMGGWVPPWEAAVAG